MSKIDPYTHMEEAWKLEGNPFPSKASAEARMNRLVPMSSPRKRQTFIGNWYEEQSSTPRVSAFCGPKALGETPATVKRH